MATQNQLSDKCVSFANKTFEQNIMEKITNVVFTRRVCKREDKFIGEMESCYNNLMKNETTTSRETIVDILNRRKWFEDELLKEKMREMAYQMRNFASFNQNNKSTGLFVREIECEETQDCCIDVWEKEKKLPLRSFEPPTEIRNLQIKEYSHDTVEIKWNVPEEGVSNISNYKIEVSSVSAVDKIEREIKVSPAAEESMTRIITNLRPGQEYKVSVQSLCLNDYAFSKSVFLHQMTRLRNPPNDFTGEVIEKRHVKLAWENPNIKAETTILKGFIIEYHQW